MKDCCIKVLTKEHGKKVVEWFKNQGVDTSDYEGTITDFYYGVFNGIFDCRSYVPPLVDLIHIPCDWVPSYREMVLVSNDNNKWEKMIFYRLQLGLFPFVCKVSHTGYDQGFKYCKPLPTNQVFKPYPKEMWVWGENIYCKHKRVVICKLGKLENPYIALPERQTLADYNNNKASGVVPWTHACDIEDLTTEYNFTLSNSTVSGVIVKENDRAFVKIDGKEVEIKEFEDLLVKITVPSKLPWVVAVTDVKIGCTKVTVEELVKLVDIAKKL